jgi:Asp-tRNAAsn/Glu-tRNAGln amidotransferase A subunit and related amidases
MRATAFRPLSTLVLLFLVVRGQPGGAQKARRVAPALEVTEASIADLQDRLRRGHVSCHALVQAYLDRIAAYDSTGPSLHAIAALSPTAIAEADSLDASFARDRRMGALHCIATIVNDDLETVAMPATAGSPALAGFASARDATAVRRIRQAGGIVLGKGTMAEFALTADEGTAPAVAASFATAGVSYSARGSVVAIRPTPGLVSRAGMIPLLSNEAAITPIGRTVSDAVALLQVVAGSDLGDSLTAAADAKRPADYHAALRRDGLAGKRIGVPREVYEHAPSDSATARLFATALGDMRRRGAIIVDRVEVVGAKVPPLTALPSCDRFKFDVDQWVAEQGNRAPVRGLNEIIGTRALRPAIRTRLEAAMLDSLPPTRNPACGQRMALLQQLRAAVSAEMDSLKLDALAYPSAPDDAGDGVPGSARLPAIIVPMGYARKGAAPAGLRIVGRVWSEPTLIAIAYGYEQGTHRRRAPASTPPLRRAR